MDYTRHQLQKILDNAEIQICPSAVGLDTGDVYGYLDSDTLELRDAVTKFHNTIDKLPSWQRSMIKNKLIDYYRKNKKDEK